MESCKAPTIRVESYGCSAAKATPPGWAPSTAGSTRPCTCSPSSTRSTTPTGGWPTGSSPSKNFGTHLARSICHGRRGTIAQPYRDGQEDQLAALGLVLNAVVLWNTRYLDASVVALRAAGHQISDEGVARLSPLISAHINTLGRYAFIPTQPERGLRPLRDPASSDAVEECGRSVATSATASYSRTTVAP